MSKKRVDTINNDEYWIEEILIWVDACEKALVECMEEWFGD